MDRRSKAQQSTVLLISKTNVLMPEAIDKDLHLGADIPRMTTMTVVDHLRAVGVHEAIASARRDADLLWMTTTTVVMEDEPHQEIMARHLQDDTMLIRTTLADLHRHRQLEATVTPMRGMEIPTPAQGALLEAMATVEAMEAMTTADTSESKGSLPLNCEWYGLMMLTGIRPVPKVGMLLSNCSRPGQIVLGIQGNPLRYFV